MSLSYNKLCGPIPDAALEGMARLRQLELNMVGPALVSKRYPTHDMGPDTTPRCPVLRHQAGLSGPLPSSLSSLTRLELLSLYQNRLTGSIPKLSLPYLTHLLLGNNNLSGTLASSEASVGATWNLPSLKVLWVHDNQLRGPLPHAFLSSLTNLKELRLENNRFSGPLLGPGFNLPSTLTKLNLAQNELTGPLPSSVSSLSQLETLSLSRNRFSGPIPESLTTLTSLKCVQLSQVSVSRSIGMLR